MPAKDRNFDQLALRFAEKIFASRKGQLRRSIICRDLEQHGLWRPYDQGGPEQVLDLGGGLGYFSCAYAPMAARVVYNDISPVMAERARQQATEAGIAQDIEWRVSPYQELIKDQAEPFQLILCHALLEWVDDKSELLHALTRLAAPGAHVSLCFYNPAGAVFRNLLRGNFHWVDQRDSFVPDQGSLTPQSPVALETVEAWIREQHIALLCHSGIRVFSDYPTEKRGGLAVDEALLIKEMEFSRLEPYWRLGRYIHLLLRMPQKPVEHTQ